MKDFATSRRGFMKGFAGGAIAAVGNKAAAVAKASGLPVAGLGVTGAAQDSYGPPVSSDTSGKIAKLLKTLKILPKFKEAELRREASQIRTMEPGIASMVSISLAAKVRMQKDINYKNSKREFFINYSADEERDSFLKKHGLDWF